MHDELYSCNKSKTWNCITEMSFIWYNSSVAFPKSRIYAYAMCMKHTKVYPSILTLILMLLGEIQEIWEIFYGMRNSIL